VVRLQSGVGETMLPPGSWHWQAASVSASGFAVVERYSDELHPRPVTVAGVAGEVGFTLIAEQARERWWLFAIAMSALVGEWVWRQRRGLP